jgi:hypothetical protein
MYTRGFTGSSKSYYRDFNQEAIKNYDNELIEKLNLYIDNDFLDLEPYNITLFFRGQIYIAVHSIMSYD